jgi:hypothetical protein
MYRFSFSREKTIIRGISAIRAISQRVTSDRPEGSLKVERREVCQRRNNSAHALFGRLQTWLWTRLVCYLARTSPISISGIAEIEIGQTLSSELKKLIFLQNKKICHFFAQ